MTPATAPGWEPRPPGIEAPQSTTAAIDGIFRPIVPDRRGGSEIAMSPAVESWGISGNSFPGHLSGLSMVALP